MDQMIQAIYDLRRAFLRMKVAPPQIVITNRDEGMRFESEITKAMQTSPEFSSPGAHPHLVEIDGALWRRATLFGDVDVRWPVTTVFKNDLYPKPSMTDLNKIRQAQIEAAEKAVIDSIPPDLLAWANKVQAEHEAKGGCPGCGSMVFAVHGFPNGRICPEIADDLY